MEKDTWQRILYCDCCMKPTTHVIVYADCFIKKDITLVHFISACIPCSTTVNHAINPHTVPLEDWTALLTKQIYADP